MTDIETNIPNEKCEYAIITGILIANNCIHKSGRFDSLFKLGYENIFVWTPPKCNHSCLVAQVDRQVKETPFWKTAGRLIQLADSFRGAFEWLLEPVDYNWMYSFSPEHSTIEELSFYNCPTMERLSLLSGKEYRIKDFFELSSMIELLARDDKAYNALSLIKEAFKLHWFCLICETSDKPCHDHLAKEPELWNQGDVLPKLETAIVQSCRAVECILGEPPRRNNKAGLIRHKEKWESILGINPDDDFRKAKKSYLDFYYELFSELRNPSAHSYGNIHYDLQRKKAVEAQCFAAEIVSLYVDKHTIEKEKAREKLNFNQSLLLHASKDSSIFYPENKQEY